MSRLFRCDRETLWPRLPEIKSAFTTDYDRPVNPSRLSRKQQQMMSRMPFRALVQSPAKLRRIVPYICHDPIHGDTNMSYLVRAQ